MSYKLLPTQQRFIHCLEDCDIDVALYQGGYGSGKSFVGSLLGLKLAEIYPGSTGLVGAFTYPMVRDTTLVSYFEHFDNYGWQFGREYQWKASEGKLYIPSWRSTILFRHLEEPMKLKSLNLAWAHLEEMSEIPESTFLMVISRLRQKEIRRYRLFGTSNPQPNKGWIHKYFVEEGGIKETEVDGTSIKVNYRRVISPSTENIHLSPAYLFNMQQTFDPEYYRINVMGEDGDYNAGLVCSTWSFANIEHVDYDPNQRLYLTCDFNVDPMCWAIAHKPVINVAGKELNQYHFFDEIVLENTNITDTAVEFAKRYKNHKAGIIITGDASGNSRSDTTARANQTRYDQLKLVLSDMGVRSFAVDVRPSNPIIESRIEVWNGLVCNQQGVRRVKVDPKCKQIIKTMENLRYIPGTSTVFVPTPHMIDRDRQQKFMRNDMFDAVSYLTYRYDPKIETGKDLRRIGQMTSVPFKAGF